MADERTTESLLAIMNGIEAVDYKLSLVLRVVVLALAVSVITAIVVLAQGFP
jgi:hypothetical protein